MLIDVFEHLYHMTSQKCSQFSPHTCPPPLFFLTNDLTFARFVYQVSLIKIINIFWLQFIDFFCDISHVSIDYMSINFCPRLLNITFKSFGETNTHIFLNGWPFLKNLTTAFKMTMLLHVSNLMHPEEKIDKILLQTHIAHTWSEFVTSRLLDSSFRKYTWRTKQSTLWTCIHKTCWGG